MESGGRDKRDDEKGHIGKEDGRKHEELFGLENDIGADCTRVQKCGKAENR